MSIILLISRKKHFNPKDEGRPSVGLKDPVLLCDHLDQVCSVSQEYIEKKTAQLTKGIAAPPPILHTLKNIFITPAICTRWRQSHDLNF